MSGLERAMNFTPEKPFSVIKKVKIASWQSKVQLRPLRTQWVKSPFDAFRLQADFDKLVDWGTINHLPLHIDKCKVLHFFRIFEPYLFGYKISGTFLEVEDTFTDLGGIYSNDFSFLPHLNFVVSKAFRNLCLIKRFTRSFTHIGAIKVLYMHSVYPHLNWKSLTRFSEIFSFLKWYSDEFPWSWLSCSFR